MEPPVRFSSGIRLTETIEICGKTIRSDNTVQIYINYLHHNPNEWQLPDEFIPDRFDPYSQYYLTPNGKKRHPMSFGPFLGGKRICIGKTFAENIAKCILPIIITQLDFEFIDKDLYIRKPNNSFANKEPQYNVKITPLISI